MGQLAMKKLPLRFSSMPPKKYCTILPRLFVTYNLSLEFPDICQGIVSGINAARHSDGKSLIVLERESSYIGTLIDDLVTKDLREPYRMLTR